MANTARQRKLERPRQWAARFFAESSMPARATVRKWVEQGLIEGEWIDGECWVYDDQLPPRTRQRRGAAQPSLDEQPMAESLAAYADKLRSTKR